MPAALYDHRGEVGVVTLNRPERLNAIGGTLLADLHAAIARAMADEAVGAIVLAGAGRAFCAGDDLKEFSAQTADAAATEAHIRGIQQITRDLMFGEKAVVGAAQGYAVGGGFEWMLNCDLVVAAEDLVAFFPEMDWAQFTTGGITHLLPQAIGHQRAMELLLLGERQSAARLAGLGLVNRVVPAAQCLATAFELAAAIARKSRWSVGRLKRLITQELGDGLSRALRLEERTTVESFARPEAAERVRRFAERR
jgi:enoyl-CoA hydratase/carnithine racemase